MSEDARTPPDGEAAALHAQVRALTARVAELEREAEHWLPHRVRELIEAAPFGSHLYELQADGRLVFLGANRAADRILGVDNRQFVGLSIEEAFPALAGGPIPDAYRRVAREGTPFETELVTYAEGDIAGAFEVSAFCIGPRRVAALFRDVTERARADALRRRAEEALRSSEERFRALIQHSSDIISLHDADGRWLYQSPSATRLFGYAPGSLIGQSPLAYIHDDDRPAVAERLLALVATADGVQRHEFRFRHADGSWRYLESIAQNLLAHPDVRAILITSRDVTDRRLLQQELVHAQKMECLGRMASSVAHDFNNVLSVIVGALEIVSQAGLGAEDLATLGEAQQAARQGAELASRLLTFARREPAELRPVDVSREIRGAERMLRRALPRRVDLALQLRDDLPPVLADPAQLLQVLMNLAINAGDAMPGGGLLTVANHAVVERRPHAKLSGLPPPGPAVAIEVRDTGTGMAGDTLEHLFEPFFTTKEAGRGTGLGLAICHGIVHRHRGAIAVDSVPGQGTAFCVYLPTFDDSRA